VAGQPHGAWGRGGARAGAGATGEARGGAGLTPLSVTTRGLLSRFPIHYPLPLQSVFGSWFDRETQSWGFACCHATLASSYCSGAAGRAAREEAERFARSAASAAAGGVAGSAASGSASAAAGSAGGGAGSVPHSSLYGEQEAPQLDARKMAAALAKYERDQARAALAAADGGGDDGDARVGGGGDKRGAAGGGKRGYNSLSGDADAGGTTAEDIEVYKLKRARAGDPMATAPGSGTSGYELLDG
jgi:hypothetical protein